MNADLVVSLQTEPFAVRIGDQAFAGRGAELEVRDPSTGERLASMAAASVEDIEFVVARARACAAKSRRAAPADRAGLCRRIAQEIRADADRLTAIEVRDGGLPVTLATKDVEAAARYFDYYGGVAETLGGRSTQAETGGLVVTTLVPWGVCGIILPFNLPLQLAARDLAPALAMGNAAVLKAPEQTPFAALALTELCARAGAPDGLVCAVAGRGDAGAAIVDHPDVAHVTFTGSHTVGVRVMEAAARRIVPSTIELGGKSPHIVFADADLTAVARAVVGAVMPTAGQACSAGTRVLVDAGLRDSLERLVSEELGRLTVGPAPDDPDVGPVVSAEQREKVALSIDKAVADGARLICGGSAPLPELPPDGNYIRPTLLSTEDGGSGIAVEEVFGPIITMVPFLTEDEAVAIANGTPFGLVTGVWTRDLERALRVAGAVDAGQVHLNGYLVGGGVGIPFGGMKRSGVGRVKGLEGASEYAQIKTLAFPAA